mgnify:CR=1 FL=1
MLGLCNAPSSHLTTSARWPLPPPYPAAADAAASAVSGLKGSGGGSKPFDSMNGVAASLLLHLTASVRFEGPLNVDLNDITMNLVPYPRMHFLLSSMSPLQPPPKDKDVGRAAAALALQPRTLDQVRVARVQWQGRSICRGLPFMTL